MEIEAGSLQLLMDLGFMAGGYGYIRQAETIFEGLRAIRPHNESPLIGLAFVKSSVEPEESIRLLEEALRINPENDLARSFMAMVLKQTGRIDRSAVLCREIVSRNRDEVAVRLAEALLE